MLHLIPLYQIPLYHDPPPRDKGGGVQNPKNFVDVVNGIITLHVHLIANCRTLVYRAIALPVFIEVDDEMSVSARRFGTI